MRNRGIEGIKKGIQNVSASNKTLKGYIDRLNLLRKEETILL